MTLKLDKEQKLKIMHKISRSYYRKDQHQMNTHDNFFMSFKPSPKAAVERVRANPGPLTGRAAVYGMAQKIPDR